MLAAVVVLALVLGSRAILIAAGRWLVIESPLKKADVIYVYAGGPLGATTTAVYHVYVAGFERFNLGYASAAAFVLFAVIALISLVQFRLFAFGRGAEE